MDLPEQLRAQIAALPGVIRIATRDFTAEETAVAGEPGLLVVCVMTESDVGPRPRRLFGESALLNPEAYPEIVELMQREIDQWAVEQ